MKTMDEGEYESVIWPEMDVTVSPLGSMDNAQKMVLLAQVFNRWPSEN